MITKEVLGLHTLFMLADKSVQYMVELVGVVSLLYSLTSTELMD